MDWSNFRFIDLFASIGGIRLGFEAAGGTVCFPQNLMKMLVRPMKPILANIHLAILLKLKLKIFSILIYY